ncbi:TBC1 domain family member 25-like isoform X3 [Pecten maximus]|uniref:TBC1 domain family member 25-like isoform X3 n=1 Tax=Pecten maximus TaxID=6579 RepID=UPI001457F268|nr:TBC1 domain family member 25-like isoform X3 [Pecten maximus]
MSSPWAMLSFTERDFTLSYRTRDDEGQEIYLSMLSDWDMDAAFQSASDPCLQLKVDLKPFEEGLDDWDIIAPVDVPQYKVSNLVERNSILGSLTGTISNQVGRTVSHMQRVMGLRHEDEQRYRPSKSPMTDMEFRNYLDSSGHMIKPEEFRISIYQGGVEPSLRRVVWRHLLNIFPIGLSGKERFDYMKRKENEYYQLRDKWRDIISSGSMTEDIRYITSMVKKDVLRTDRTLKYFAGGDDSKNLLSLFNILVTYAITHPEVSYCQGMSDVASPLLVIQKDEAQAYLCFCGIMARMKTNFTLNENAMNLKFKHLSDILQLHDPILYSYLKDHDAGDLFFCYRWLLLELKREFPFEDALYMLEVMWSTLPPMYPESELPLTDLDFSLALLSTSPCSPSYSKKPSIYEKFKNMRRVKSTKVKDVNKPQNLEILTGEETGGNSVNNNNVLVSKNATNAGNASPFEDEKSIVGAQDFPSMKDSMVVDAQAKSSCIDKSLETEMESKVKKLHDSDNKIQTETDIAEETEEGKNLKQQTTDIGSCKSVLSVSDLSSSVHDERPAGTFYNGDMTSETPTEGTDSEEVETIFSQDLIQPDGSINNDPNFCRDSLTTELKTDGTDDELCNDYVDEDQDDSGHSQFYLSLDSTDEGQTEASPVVSDNKSVKKPGERAGFFHNVKEFISIPKKRPTDIQIPKVVAGFKAPDIVQGSLKTDDLQTVENGNASQKIHLSNGLINGKKMYPGKAVLSPVSASPANGEKLTIPNMSSSSVPLNDSGMSLSDCTEISDDSSLEVIKHSIPSIRLPPPDVFGNGNPFLMFVCLTLLMQHREAIMHKQLEYDEIAMMFDRMVRKHNVHKVLHQARVLYTDYLQTQKKMEEQAEADDHVFSV